MENYVLHFVLFLYYYIRCYTYLCNYIYIPFIYIYINYRSRARVTSVCLGPYHSQRCLFSPRDEEERPKDIR